MFRFSRNHHQALSKKYKDPLHKTIKTRFGIPNVHNKHLVMIQRGANLISVINKHSNIAQQYTYTQPSYNVLEFQIV